MRSTNKTCANAMGERTMDVMKEHLLLCVCVCFLADGSPLHEKVKQCLWTKDLKVVLFDYTAVHLKLR